MVKSEKRGSNPRPRPWQGRALPTELFSQNQNCIRTAKLVLYCGCKCNIKIQLYKRIKQKSSNKNIMY